MNVECSSEICLTTKSTISILMIFSVCFLYSVVLEEKWRMFERTGCFSHYRINSIKALKSPIGLIFCSSTSEVSALLTLCHLLASNVICLTVSITFVRCILIRFVHVCAIFWAWLLVEKLSFNICIVLAVITEEDSVESATLHAEVTSSQTVASLVLNTRTVSAELCSWGCNLIFTPEKLVYTGKSGLWLPANPVFQVWNLPCRCLITG